jgi:hypothetical protein
LFWGDWPNADQSMRFQLSSLRAKKIKMVVLALAPIAIYVSFAAVDLRQKEIL